MSILTRLPRRAPKQSDTLMTLDVDDHGEHRVDVNQAEARNRRLID